MSSSTCDLMSPRSLPTRGHCSKRRSDAHSALNDLNASSKSSPRRHSVRKNDSSALQTTEIYPHSATRNSSCTDWEKIHCSQPSGSEIDTSPSRFATIDTFGGSCERLKSCLVSPKLANGKAVAVIKGTASTTAKTCSPASSHSDWKKHLHSHEVRKLKRELEQANEKVASLTSQLATHGHMVTAFEQSLASMSVRLQQLTVISGQKDCELIRLKAKIEELKDNRSSEPPATPSKKSLKKDRQEKERKSLIRRHTFVHPSPGCESDSGLQNMQEQKDVSWYRKAFRKNSKSGSRSVSGSDVENDAYVTSIRVSSVQSLSRMERKSPCDPSDPSLMSEMKKQLREKEKLLTDLRLESLTSAHQMQSLEEAVTQMRGEIMALRQENERLQRSTKRPSPTESGKEAGPHDWATSDEASGYASVNSVLLSSAYDTY